MPYIKLDQNLRTKVIKLIEGQIQINLYNFGLGSSFLSATQKAQLKKGNENKQK